MLKILQRLFGKKKAEEACGVSETLEESCAASEMAYDELQQRIAAVIASCYKDCSVETEVPASRFDSAAHEKAKPISVLVSKNGAACLAVAVVTKNTYRSMPVLGTQRGVEQAGVPYMRFFRELPNKESYIADRVKEYLH